MGAQIGTSALGAAGSILGGFLGGPIGSAIGGMAGGIIGSLIFNRKAKPLVPDVQLMNSSYGRPIPIIWGTMRLPAQMIWMSSITTEAHTVGKSFGQTQYDYKQSAALAFCEGVVAYKKLFLDGRLFIDNTALFPDELTKYKFAIRQYTGDDQQLADPLMVSWVQNNVVPNNSCPAYRGLAYLVFDNPVLNHFGNRFPQTTAILTTTSTPYTVFKKFERFTPKGMANAFGPYVDSCVDWIRGVIYAIYRPRDWSLNVFDHTNWGIMVFDLYTQTETHAADINDIFFDGALLPGVMGGVCDIQGITCAPGGLIYLLVTNFSHQFCMTIQTNTLVYSGSIVQLTPRNGAPANSITQFKGFELVSAAGGVSYLVAGVWPGTGVFVCNPLEGTISNPYPVEYQNPAPGATTGGPGNMVYQLGAVDQLSGTVDIWIINTGSSDPAQRVLIYKDKIVGSDPSMAAEWGSIRLEDTLTAVDFGLAGPTFPSWGPPGSRGTFYYPADDSLIIQINGLYNVKYSHGGGVSWFANGGTYGWDNPYAQTDLGYFPFTYGGLIQIILSGSDLFLDLNIATAAQDGSPVRPGDYVDNAVPLAAMHSNSYGNFVIWQGYFTQELWISYLQRQQDANAKVADIIRDICHRVGVTDDMLDLSLVTQETQGYAIQEMKSAGAAIADLLHVYRIDMIESDYRLKFVPRGQGSVVTIPQSDLVSLDTGDPSLFWRVKEAQQQEMPMILVLRFQDPSLDFQSGATYAKRTELPVNTIWSKRRMTIDLPVIASSTEATQVANTWLYTMWAERDTVETVLPWKYLYLDPADNITVAMDTGDSFEVRIEEENIGANLTMHINAAFEDATVYNPSPTLRGASYGFLPQTVQQAPFAELLQFNVPLLQDQDDTGGVSTRIYYAVGPTSAGWLTGEIFRSTDNSATWQDFINIPFAANWGTAVTELADTPSKFATDYANTVTVTLLGGSATPQSCTYDDMMSGANGALLGQEVIQYRLVTTNADGSVTLSELLRGRRGTDWATGLHTAGDTFIMLQPGHIGGNSLSLAEINAQELWKLVPSGRFIDQAVTDAFTYRGFDLMPYAPVQLKRSPFPDTGSIDVTLSWVRRTRLGNVLMDGTDTAPLYEAAELYNVYILPDAAAILLFNPANPLSYTRSFLGLTTPSCVYTGSMMTTDGFYSASMTLYFVVYQVSSVVGMGFQAYAALPPN